MDTTLPERLGRARARRALSARALDRAAGLHEGHVSQIERGTIRSVEAATVVKLAAALSVPFAWLAIGEGAEPRWDEEPSNATGA